MRKHVLLGRAMMATITGALLANDACAQTENWNKPHLRPEAHIALAAQPPVIDGAIGDDEWQGLHVSRFVAQRADGTDLLQPRPGEFWLACDGQTLFVAVRSGVHPTAGAVAAHKPEGKKDIGDTVHDDSIELWIDNAPDGRTGKYYQIMVNSLGAVYDKMHDRGDGSANLWWRPENFRQAHTVKEGVWSAEFAIPLADLEIADPGKPVGLRVCRNYKHGWDQSRWAPGVNSFDSSETMGRVRFSAAAPAVSETGFQAEAGIAVGVAVANPGAAPLPIAVKLGYNAEQQPRYFQDWNAVLAPGERRVFTYTKEFFSPENYPALAEIRVTGPNGATYYQRDVKWHTQPKTVWDKVAVASKDDAFDFAIEWHPTPKLLRWRVDFAAFQDRAAVKALRLAVCDEEGARTHQEQRLAAPTSGATEQRFALPALPDGRFRADLYADTGDAAADAKPVKSALFEHRSDFDWLNNGIGISDEVIPPFTPLTVQGREVGAVLRTHTLTDDGLWGRIVADGADILAAPMRFEVRQDGKPQPVRGTLRVVETAPHRVVTEAAWQAGSVRGLTRGTLDYDGCLKVTLDLNQEGDAPVEALDLVIPLKDARTPLMHACGDGLRINFGGAVPAGTGEVWSSLKASRSDLIGTFLPYLWVGEEGRGLCWFAANDRDWVVDTGDKTAALALERNNGTLALRIRLIQKPARLTRTHRITFGLMATPAKPMPADWRQTGLFHGGKRNATFLGMCMYWGGQLYGVFPMDRDFTVVRKIAESAKEGKRDDAFFADYIGKHPDVANEVRWSANLRNAQALVPYTNLRGANTFTPEWRVYQDEWRRGNFGWRQTKPDLTSGSIDFSVIPTPSHIDFLLYYYREFLRAGMDGIYWDNICLYANANRVTSEGYVREDGLFQPEADIWRLREVTKRTAVLAHQLGKTNVNMPHMTNASLIPVFSWTGFYLGWEWKYGDSDWQERFSRAYIRSINIGRQAGNIPGVLEGHTHQIADPEKRAWVQRTRAGVVLTHEIIVQMPDPLLQRAREAMFALGYGSDAARVHTYWDANPVLSVTGLDSSWLVVANDERLMLVLCDWGDGSPAAELTLDTQRLGLAAGFTASNWEQPEQTFTAVGGRLTLPAIKRHDVLILTISK